MSIKLITALWNTEISKCGDCIFCGWRFIDKNKQYFCCNNGNIVINPEIIMGNCKLNGLTIPTRSFECHFKFDKPKGD